MTKTYKVNMITVDGRTIPIAHRVFESRDQANAYAQQLIESAGYRGSRVVENAGNLKAAAVFQFPDGDDLTATRVVRVIEIPKSIASDYEPEYIGAEIRKSSVSKEMRAQGARYKGTLVTWHGNLDDEIAKLKQQASGNLLPVYKREAEDRLRKLKAARDKIGTGSMNEATAVSMAAAQRKIRDGEWEAMEDLRPGKHVEIRITKNNKRKTYYINEDIATDAIKMEHDHEVQMARGQLYHAARDAMRLHKILKGISEEQGIEGWVAAKITRAADYLNSVADYMEHEHVSKQLDAEIPNAATIVLQGLDQPINEGAYKNPSVQKEYEKLKDISKSALIDIYKQNHRVSDDAEIKSMSKSNLISDILRAKFGKRVDETTAASIAKKVQRAAQGWSKTTPMGDPGAPKDVVDRVKALSDKELLDWSKSNRKIAKGSPADLQMRAINREIKRRGLGETTAAGSVAAVAMPLGQPRKRAAAKKR